MQHRQRGIAMVEILGALLIAAMLFKGISSMVDSSMEDTKAQQTAQYQAQMVTAASKFLAANYSSYAVAGNVDVLQTIEFAALKTALVLPPGMNDTNPYGQKSCLLIMARNKAVAGPPATTAIVLDALVVTVGNAAQAIPETVLAYAAASAGPGGGYISNRNSARVQGTSGSWALDPTTTPTMASMTAPSCSGRAMAAGSLASALFSDEPGKATDFLYRNKMEDMPELNQMNTPLALKTGATDSAEVVAGADCKGAAIAVNKHKSLMHCNKSNKWQRVTAWKEAVSDYAALESLGAADDHEDGDVRMVRSLGRAFMFNGPTSKWTPLAADKDNHMWVQNLTAEFDVVARQDVRARREATAARVTADGEITAGGNITAGGTVQGSQVIATVDVTAGQDVKAGRDVTAVRDVEATRNLVTKLGGAYVHHLLVEQWASAATMAIWDRKSAGEKCHIPKIVDGKTVFDYPIGTMVLDMPVAGAPVMMICTGNSSADAVFVYPNGTGER